MSNNMTIEARKQLLEGILTLSRCAESRTVLLTMEGPGADAYHLKCISAWSKGIDRLAGRLLNTLGHTEKGGK